MTKMIRYILLFVVAVFSACQFDHLHYETNLLTLIRIDIDWSKTHIDPNGVTAYIYNSNGDLHKELLSRDPNTLFLKLPAGEYNIVLHNNSISEIGGVATKELKRFESATIYSTERRDDPSFDVVGEPMIFANEPDDVASYTLRDIKITQSDIEYHYYKPNISDYEQEATYTYTATPRHIVHLARVIAHIGGLEYAKGAPTAILRGMSGGYNFDQESTADIDVMEQFKINTRVSKADDSGDDIIYVNYNTFGLHRAKQEAKRYYLDLRFHLIDGSYKTYHIDVTKNIRTEATKTQNLHIIELELEPLPEVEEEVNPDEDNNEGQFDPSTDDWIDVEVNVPM